MKNRASRYIFGLLNFYFENIFHQAKNTRSDVHSECKSVKLRIKWYGNKSVPAFSIIESIVGLAITAIIMGIIFVIFSIVSGRMLDYKNQNELVNDLNRLTYSINKDIFENEKMYVIENEMVFNGYSGETVKYSFMEEYILRNNQTFIDTFKIRLKEIGIDSVKNNSQKMVFQKLKLKVEVNESEMDLKFYKRVYANELLQAIKE